MPWGKMDDKFHRNRKVRRLRRLGAKGREALGVWVFWWSWCLDDDGTFDGFVPMDELDASELKAAALLVESGLWDKAENGFRFHDFNIYNPTKKQVQDKREADRLRQQQWRDKHRESQGVSQRDSQSDTECDSQVESRRESHPARARAGREGDLVSPRQTDQDPEPRPHHALCALWAADTGILEIDVSSRDQEAARQAVAKLERAGVAWADAYARWRADEFVQREEPPLTHFANNLQKYTRARRQPESKEAAARDPYSHLPVSR